MLTMAEKIVKSSQEELVVPILNVVYDNKDTFKHYIDFCSLAKKYRGRAAVIPVVCTEHTFISAINNIHLVKDKQSYTTCVDVDEWHQAGLLQTEADRRYAVNFEHFCKLFMIKGVQPCLSTSRLVGEVENSQYLYYYSQNCRCQVAFSFCEDQTLMDKAMLFLNKQPLRFDQDVPLETLLDVNEKACSYLNLIYEKHGKKSRLIPLRKIIEKQ